MTEEELRNIEGPYSWIAKDLEDMQYFAGGQIITDVKRLVATVRQLSQENEQLKDKLSEIYNLHPELED